MEILIINGNDYSRYIKQKGVGWARNDLDSDKTTRTKDGRMRRQKITTKRKLTFTMLRMSRELMAQLDNDLSAQTFRATYRDLHGTQTREFYCSSFSATLSDVQNGVDIWEGASFSLIEV